MYEKLIKSYIRDTDWRRHAIMQISLDSMEHMHNAIKHYAEKIKVREVWDGSKVDYIERSSTNNTADHFLQRYLGLKDRGTIMTIHDPCKQLNGTSNEKNTVTLSTYHGNVKITAERYMDLMETFQPDLFQGLNDANTDQNSSKKRIAKSLQRTITFTEYCYERYMKSSALKGKKMLAPIVGGYDIEARLRCIDKMKTLKNCIGYIFEGFHMYGESATQIDLNTFLPVVRKCLNTIRDGKKMTKDTIEKLIMFPGAYTPPVILQLVKYGVDAFDTSYAYCATKNHKALCFYFHWEVPLNKTEADKLVPYIDITDDW